MKLYTLYFSPTGGTKKVINTISSIWSCEKVEVDLSNRNIKLADIKFNEDDVCMVAVPSYGGRIPQFIIPKLKKIKCNGNKVMLIITYGNRAYEDTIIELKDTLENVGFNCVCGIAAVTQHSIINDYAKGRPDSDDIMELKNFAAKCKYAIDNDLKEINFPGNRPYREYLGVPFTPKTNNKCIMCGLCAVQCPVEAISLDNFKELDKKKCISCMQCITVCPQHARYLSKFMIRIAKLKMNKVCSERKKNELFCPEIK